MRGPQASAGDVVQQGSPLFTVVGQEISGRDLILLLGGLFLIAKSTHEIHQKLEGAEGEASGGSSASFFSIIVQILLLDIVFSLDSVLTAIGMVQRIEIMIAAVVIAVVVAVLGMVADDLRAGQAVTTAMSLTAGRSNGLLP